MKTLTVTSDKTLKYGWVLGRHMKLDELATGPKAGQDPHANWWPNDSEIMLSNNSPHLTLDAYKHIWLVIHILIRPAARSYTTSMHVYNLYHSDGY